MTYLRLGLAIGVVLALIGAYFYGKHDGRTACERDHAVAQAKADAARDVVIRTAQQEDQRAAEADVQRETIVREITREVPRIIDRPVYRTDCIDADGVRLIRRAVEAANGGTPGGGSAGDAAEVHPAPGIDRPGDR